MKNTGSAFKIYWDLALLGDDEYSANHIPFGIEKLKRGYIYPNRKKLPDKIYFLANFRALEMTDYPFNDLKWPIMSRKMLDVLLSVREFSHRKIPVVMIDDTCQDAIYAINGELKPGVPIITDYYVVQNLNFTDAFDRDHSEFIPSELNPDRVGNVFKLIFNRDYHRNLKILKFIQNHTE